MADLQWKFAVNTNSLPRDKSPGDIAKTLSALNVDGVEWGLPDLEKAAGAAREMVKVSGDYGLEICGFLNAGLLTKTDQIRRWSEAVTGAGGGGGGKFLRVSPFWVAWNYQESLHQRESFPEMFKKVRDGLERLVPLSHDYGIRYVVETHPGNIVPSAALARQLMEGLNPAAVGVIYDPANGIGEGHLRPRSVVEILGPYLAYVHAKNLRWEPQPGGEDNGIRRVRWECTVCRPDEGILDWEEVFFALNVGGYRGWLALEEFLKIDPPAEITRGIEFLKQCAQAAADQPREPFTTFNQ